MWDKLCLLLILANCIWIFIDDLKHREIHVIAAISLFALMVIQSLLLRPFFWWQDICINLLVISIIFTSTLAYLRWIRGAKTPWNTHLGWGDVLFFVAITPIGSTPFFILIFLCLTLLATIIGIIGMKIWNWQNIPYAGISALGLIFFLISPYFNLTFEQWLFDKLM